MPVIVTGVGPIFIFLSTIYFVFFCVYFDISSATGIRSFKSSMLSALMFVLFAYLILFIVSPHILFPADLLYSATHYFGKPD